LRQAEDRQRQEEEEEKEGGPRPTGKLVAYNVVVAADNQYLAPDLTAPLLDTQGSLIHGFASKPNL
jgi:hypothetical protein